MESVMGLLEMATLSCPSITLLKIKSIFTELARYFFPLCIEKH